VFHARPTISPEVSRWCRSYGRALGGRQLGLTVRVAEMVFFWKNGMEVLRSTKVTAMLPFLFPLTGLGVGAATAGMSLTGASGPAAGL
jgi:hypothetical protein